MSGKEAVVTTDGNPRGPRTTRGPGPGPGRPPPDGAYCQWPGSRRSDVSARDTTALIAEMLQISTMLSYQRP